MSLPSISVIAREKGVDFSGTVPDFILEQILEEAMRRDLKPALDILHAKAHEADKNPDGRADWIEDPNSPVGKMLIRIHAGDQLRRIASTKFCHGKQLTFFNCCKGVVGTPPAHQMLIQIQCQNGTIAHADC